MKTTVGELKELLSRYDDDDEVFIEKGVEGLAKLGAVTEHPLVEDAVIIV